MERVGQHGLIYVCKTSWKNYGVFEKLSCAQKYSKKSQLVQR